MQITASQLAWKIVGPPPKGSVGAMGPMMAIADWEYRMYLKTQEIERMPSDKRRTLADNVLGKEELEKKATNAAA